MVIPTGINATVAGWDKLAVGIGGRVEANCGLGICGLALELRGQLKYMAANVGEASSPRQSSKFFRGLAVKLWDRLINISHSLPAHGTAASGTSTTD